MAHHYCIADTAIHGQDFFKTMIQFPNHEYSDGASVRAACPGISSTYAPVQFPVFAAGGSASPGAVHLMGLLLRLE